MESLIDQLVTGYERGTLTRRALIQGLSAVAAAGLGATTASAASLRAGSINHTSVLVSDMARSLEWYGRVFGFKILSEDKEHKIARLGINKVLVSLRVEPPSGQIDHFAIGIENFNKEAVTKELQGMGLTPSENVEYGFYVKDPDGAVVQMTGV
jgi:catechol 2,3-dioxygenase-like lactoylglutathione lyase family enzyme